MDFSQVDTPFDNWARENNLQVFKMYKDYEVRSVDIVKSSQSKWQLWLEPKPELKNTLELIQETILSKKGCKGVNT